MDARLLGLLNKLLPAGLEFPFAGTRANVPAGWLQSDGSAVSRTTYAALFAAIGTTWGVGDGSTTFNLPDRRARFLKGVNGTDPGNTGGAATHTPAGTNSAPTFSGTNFTLSSASNGVNFNAVTSTKPAGSVSAPTFTGTSANYEPAWGDTVWLIKT